ncbi:MAG: alanine racemase [Bacillota bacterium]
MERIYGRPDRPAWAEVDLGAIAHNVKELIRVKEPRVKFMAVVKANGYGHGAVPVAKAALAAGAEWLGVAILSEALELRRAGLAGPVLALGFTPPEQSDAVVANDISQTVYTVEAARALSEAAARAGRPARVHLKVDTGMGRLGVTPDEAGLAVTRAIAGLPGLILEGVFTHFATADAVDKGYARAQFERFAAFLARLEAAGLRFGLRHAANSAALIDLPETHLDLVRAGIAIYGLYPSDEVERRVDLRPAMSLKVRVAHVKEVPAGTGVSYGRTFVTGHPSVIATLPIGYADGYPRSLSSRGVVLVRGRRAPIIGRVCMDQCMADVTGIPGVTPGDEVVLMGRQGDEAVTADDLARLEGTINYEVVCDITARVPRVYSSAGDAPADTNEEG